MKTTSLKTHIKKITARVTSKSQVSQYSARPKNRKLSSMRQKKTNLSSTELTYTLLNNMLVLVHLDKISEIILQMKAMQRRKYIDS